MRVAYSKREPRTRLSGPSSRQEDDDRTDRNSVRKSTKHVKRLDPHSLRIGRFNVADPTSRARGLMNSFGQVKNAQVVGGY